MNYIIEITNLTYKCNDLYIFDNFNLSIKEKTFLTIMGPSSCGKSLLANLIYNKDKSIKVKGNVSLAYIKNYDMLVRDIIDDISILKKFKIDSIIDCNYMDLSYSKKALINILQSICENPDILIIDNLLSKLDKNTYKKIINLLCSLDITIINITNNIEDSLYSKELLILNKNKVVLYDEILKAYEEEKILKENNIPLPFTVSLSNKLKYYGLLNNTVLDIDKMVDKIWK